MSDAGQTTAFIHQIMLVDGYHLPAQLPPLIDANRRALRELYPDAAYTLWSGDALREEISQGFGRDVLNAFDTLAPYAYKSDLARFCLLYRHGGLYVDLTNRLLNPLRPPAGAGIASFRDYDLLSPSWTAVNGGVLWATPGRAEFEIAIDYVLENCRTRFYGRNPLYPTGPVLLGRALAAAMARRGQQAEADDQWIGVCRPLTPGQPTENVAFIAPDHSLVGMRMKGAGGDLVHVGMSGSNNYNDFWHRRTAYGERTAIWTFADPALRVTPLGRRQDDGIVAVGGTGGHLTYGPYIRLDPGSYRVTVAFAGPVKLPRMLLDVAHGGGVQIARRENAPVDNPGPFEIHLDFESDKPLLDVEFRTELFGPMDGRMIELRLETL